MQNSYDESETCRAKLLGEGRETGKHNVKVWDINTQLLTSQVPKTVKIKDLRTSNKLDLADANGALYQRIRSYHHFTKIFIVIVAVQYYVSYRVLYSES